MHYKCDCIKGKCSSADPGSLTYNVVINWKIRVNSGVLSRSRMHAYI